MLLLFDIFRKTTIHSDTRGTEVLTKKLITTTAIETSTTLSKQCEVGEKYTTQTAIPYRNADICNAAVANVEAFYVLTHLDDFTDSLVPWNEREFGDKFSLMNVTVSATNTTARHFKQSRIRV